MGHDKTVEIINKINSITWLAGAVRELYLISALSFGRAFCNFAHLGVRSQSYSLLIRENGRWNICWTKADYDQVSESIQKQLNKDNNQVRANLENLEVINQEIDWFYQQSFDDLTTIKDKLVFQKNLEKLTDKYCPIYLYNVRLGHVINKVKQRTDLIEKIIYLRNIANYLKLEQIFKKFIKYIGLKGDMAEFYSFDDIKNFVQTNTEPKVVQKRVAIFVEQRKIQLITRDVSKIQRPFQKIKFNKIGDAIKGSSAYSGKVKGVVRLVKTASDYKKLRQGDILVIPMTRPDIVPYLKFVEAIVTDEGGILSHAAIVSRELGIPCIINTKIATQVLRDGQKVEVDADKGVVRVIK